MTATKWIPGPANRQHYRAVSAESGSRVLISLFEEQRASAQGEFSELLARRFRRGVKNNDRKDDDLRAEREVAAALERAADGGHGM